MKVKVFAVRKINEIRVRGAGGLTGSPGPKGDTGEPGPAGPPGIAPIVQTTGNSTTDVMSQNAVTIELNAKQDSLTPSQLQAVDSGITADKVQKIADIEELIPLTASIDNKLTDVDFVNSSINSVTAFFVTYDASGAPFPTKAALDSATIFYYAGKPRVPTKNDYCLVNADETHDGAACRYVLQEQNNEMVWAFQYRVNDTPFTAAQLAAINSGITASVLATLQTGKLDKVTSTSTLPQVYTKTGAGEQTMVDVSAENKANTMIKRNGNGIASIAIPTSRDHIANKGYVDDADAANKKYVDDIVGNIETILNSINSGNGGGV